MTIRETSEQEQRLDMCLHVVGKDRQKNRIEEDKFVEE